MSEAISPVPIVLAARPKEASRTLPPPPWTLRQYFAHRRQPNLGRGVTEDEERINDNIWLDIVAGRPTAPATLGQDEDEATATVALEAPADETRNLASTERRCAGCGKRLHHRKGTKFCSPRCRLRVWRTQAAA